MVISHGMDKSHSCEICGKDFFLRWRLKKHLDVHDENVKVCRYFRDGCHHSQNRVKTNNSRLPIYGVSLGMYYVIRRDKLSHM